MTRTLIIGGTSGIGRALADLALLRGETVTVIGRRVEGLPDGVECISADLSLAREHHRIVETLAGRSINRMIFTAGGLSARSRVTDEGRDAAFMVNHVARERLANGLLDRISGGARIGYVSSWGSYKALPPSDYVYGAPGRDGMRHVLNAYIPNDALFARLALARPDFAILGFNPGPTRGTDLASRAETPFLLKLIRPVFSRVARDVEIVAAEFDHLLETAPTGISWTKASTPLSPPPHVPLSETAHAA